MNFYEEIESKIFQSINGSAETVSKYDARKKSDGINWKSGKSNQKGTNQILIVKSNILIEITRNSIMIIINLIDMIRMHFVFLIGFS